MIITHKLQSMDLTHKQNTSRIDVVQDDKYSRDVEFTLTENGVAWQIPDGTTAVVRYKKPDGTGGNYDALPDGSTAYQINGNVLTVAMAPQVCTVTGSVQLSVGLIQGNAEINTFSVNIVVHPNPGAEYQSEDYIKLSGAVPNSGWTPNMYLGTDASGNVVAKEGTGGGGSTSGKDGGYYTPSVTQPDENTMRVSYTPSESSMPEVESMDVMLPTGADGKSAYQYAQDGGYTGTEVEFAAKLAEEIPDKLPNPNALTFTGAVTGSYDGSAPVSVKIPDGGSGEAWELIDSVTLSENVTVVTFNFDTPYKKILFVCQPNVSVSGWKLFSINNGIRIPCANIAISPTHALFIEIGASEKRRYQAKDNRVFAWVRTTVEQISDPQNGILDTYDGNLWVDVAGAYFGWKSAVEINSIAMKTDKMCVAGAYFEVWGVKA